MMYSISELLEAGEYEPRRDPSRHKSRLGAHMGYERIKAVWLCTTTVLARKGCYFNYLTRGIVVL